MSVDRDEVERIATLARLRFGDDEIVRLTAELNGILEHVERLRTVAGTIEDPAGVADVNASTRPTEEGGPDPLARAPADIAPDFTRGFFVVPPPPGVHRDGD